MIYLLYGPDTFRSRRKLNEIISEYRKKAGSDFGFHRLDAEENNSSFLKTAIGSSSLFSSKKLIVVENCFVDAVNFEFIFKTAKGIKDSAETIVILWDRELDSEKEKRLKEIKPFIGKIQEFPALSKESVSRFIQEEAKKRGVKLFPLHLALLASFGPDLWVISNELDKMALAQPDDVKENPQDERTIFDLGDTFFTNRQKGLFNLLKLLRAGHDDFNLFSYLANHNRTLLVIKNYLDKKKAVPANAGIHPYVVKKAISQVRDISFDRLHSTFRGFFEEDIKIKTGLSKPADSLTRMLMERKEP